MKIKTELKRNRREIIVLAFVCIIGLFLLFPTVSSISFDALRDTCSSSGAGINGTGIQGPMGPQGPPGADGLMNMTPNMTAGPAGYTPQFGIDYFNGSDGYTPVFGVDYFNGSVGATGEQGNQGIPGLNNMTPGADGAAATIGVNYTFAGNPGTNAIVSNIGSSSAALFDFTIPTGATGSPGSNGTNGTAATIDVNYTSIGAAGSSATVTNVGTTAAALLDFVIPQGLMNQTPGEQGQQGNPGTPGTNGTAATITINNTATGNAGTNAEVSNIGTTAAAIFDFIIPKGATGETGAAGTNGTDGDDGTAATITINNTVTLLAGNPATVDNIGSSSAALFDFGIPQGTQGDQGIPGAANMTAGPQGPQGDQGIPGINGTIPDSSQFPFLNGTRTLTGIWDFGGYNLSNLLDPVSPQDAATRNYVDSVNASLSLGTFTSTYPLSLTQSRQVVGGPLGLSLKNDQSQTINEVSTNTTLQDNNSSIPTSGAIKSYVDAHSSNYNASYWTGTNYNSSYLTSTFNATYDSKPSSTFNSTYDAKPDSTFNATYDSKIGNPVYGYLTLMAGSGMVTTTNPGTMNQWETSGQKNNFIYWNFTDGGTETVQWIVDFPADWNSSANVIFAPMWTAQSGSGTVHFDVSGKLFANDDAIDTALAAIGDSEDTLLTAGDMHVGPDTAGAAISSVSTGGNTAIIKVARDSATDNLGATAQLLGLRVKYLRILA